MNGTSQKLKSNKTSSAILDKYTVQEKVVPLLKAIRTKEPAVMMAALAVFAQIASLVDTDFFAMDCLPILWSFSLGPLLNLQQFSEFMNLIKKMSAKIEEEQMKKLKDLSIESANGFDATRSKDLMSIGSSNDNFGESDSGERDFERLVLGKSLGFREIGSIRPQPQSFQSTQAWSPAFSWPTSPQGSSMNSVLQPQPTSSSGAITPDQGLHGFAPLKPSPIGSNLDTRGTSWDTFQPIQSMRPTQFTNLGANPLASSQQANAKFPSTWTSPPITNNSTFTWTNPPAPQNLVANSMPNNDFNQPIPSRNPFSLPPPVSQSGAKTGLDKYESLI